MNDVFNVLNYLNYLILKAIRPPHIHHRRILPHILANSPHTYQKPTSPTCRGAPSQGRRCGERENVMVCVPWLPSPLHIHPPRLYPISAAFEPLICGPFLSPSPITGTHHPPLQPGPFADTIPSVPPPIFTSLNRFPHFLQELLSSGSLL